VTSSVMRLWCRLLARKMFVDKNQTYRQCMLFSVDHLFISDPTERASFNLFINC